MKERLGVLLTLITVCLGLAGCGGIQDSTQPPENSISLVGPKAQTPPLRAKVALKFRPVQKPR
jgi:hypothetical protein